MINSSLQNINNNDYDYANPQKISVNGFTATVDGYLVAYVNLRDGCYLGIKINNAIVDSVIQSSIYFGGTCAAHVRKGNVITFDNPDNGFLKALFYPKAAQ